MHTALDTADLPSHDVRTVAVIWTEGEPNPTVSWSGCSAYEALGMAVAAVDYLKCEYPISNPDDEDEDDYV